MRQFTITKSQRSPGVFSSGVDDHEIIIPLGEYADEFDIDAIADDLIVHGGIPINPEFYINPDKDFWAVVEAHDLSKITN